MKEKFKKEIGFWQSLPDERVERVGKKVERKV